MNAVIARVGERPLPDEVLRQAFDLWWPQLEQLLQVALAIETTSGKVEEGRNSDEMIQELVENTRSIAGIVESLASRLAPTIEPKPVPQKSFTVEPEVLEATRAALSKLLDELDTDIPASVGMERAIEGWSEFAEASA